MGQQLLSPALNPASTVKAKQHPIVPPVLPGTGKTRKDQRGERRTRMWRESEAGKGVCVGHSSARGPQVHTSELGGVKPQSNQGAAERVCHSTLFFC